MKKNIPNMLTLSRFVFIPFIVLAILSENYIQALILITLSGITDVLDGTIARKFNYISDFGKLVDPLADKATQLSILITLAVKQIIPIWVICIILVKEVLMIIGAILLYGKKTVVASRWYGKLTTVLVYLAIVSSCIINHYNIWVINNPELNKEIIWNFDIILYVIVIISTLFSLFMYWKDDYRKKEKAE